MRIGEPGCAADIDFLQHAPLFADSGSPVKSYLQIRGPLAPGPEEMQIRGPEIIQYRSGGQLANVDTQIRVPLLTRLFYGVMV